MNNSKVLTNSKGNFDLLVVTLIVFLFNPTVGLLISLMMVVSCKDDYRDNRNDIVTFFLILAAWISVVNITKAISGDQGTYTRIFLKVPDVGLLGTIHAWGVSVKEPAFSLLTWTLYWLIGGNVRLYYFILSMAIYLFHFFATYKLFKKMNVSKGALICGVLTLTFFTQYFVMTLQLVRQMLASGIVIYALVDRAVTGKNNWIMLILAVLMHTSAVFIAVLSLLPWFYSWMNIRRVLIVVVCFVPMIIFNEVVAHGFIESVDVAVFKYGAEKYGETGLNDGLDSIKIGIMLLVFVPLILSCIRILRYCYLEKLHRNIKYKISYKPIMPIVYIFMLLTIFVLSFVKSPLIQYRFFYYSYSFIPLLLPLLFVKKPVSQIYWGASSLFFIVRFFVTHNTSGWTYASVPDILSSTMYFFWTGNFHPFYLQ